MGMIPIDRMWERTEIARQDSDTTLFLNLLYFGEMLLKLVGAGMIAAVEDDRERHRYRQLHRVVRADGIGDWVAAIDDVLNGPALQYLTEQARVEQAELTSKNGPASWQYEAVLQINACITIAEPAHDGKLPGKIDARRWMALFAMLRNKTRGHGAVPAGTLSLMSKPLEDSIRLFTENFSLFRRPWAYLYRNLSGRYRVTKLTQPGVEFDPLKTASANLHVPDGVYVYFAQPMKVDLLESNVDATDFWLPNGGFTEKSYELISYITSDVRSADSAPFLGPATPLPTSETQGVGDLEVQGDSWGNLPPLQREYVHRKELERQLYDVLTNDRHPVITLVGRGGIGKTWLTLTVLHKLAAEGKFSAILWFSARDIDLLPQGPKLVAAHVLTARDVAAEYTKLVQPIAAQQKGFNATEHLAQQMTKSDLGPVLFVFDNFETVRVPGELYVWIDTYIRLPNKVLITTRTREFKGDYPIEVPGMTEHESDVLIVTAARALNIEGLLTETYKHDLYQESDGHPYVMKVLLGEVAKAGKLSKVERIVATLDDILDALFERTYVGLSPVARRVFLTLCTWRSAIPILALEAVLLRPENERMDVSAGAEELSRSSFIEIIDSKKDNELFIVVPLVAEIFGRRKLATSPMRSAIEADLPLLHAFGASQESDIQRGITPRIERLFVYVADRIAQGKDTLDSFAPMLEFIARKYPPAWLLLSRLYQEIEAVRNIEKAKDALRRYIEANVGNSSEKQGVWDEIARLCHETIDPAGEIHALVEMCQLPSVPFRTITSAVNRVNALLSGDNPALDTEERRIVSRHLAGTMESRVTEADATDCSRLAWLYIRLHEDSKAKQIVERGLHLEPNNFYCRNLAPRLGIRLF